MDVQQENIIKKIIADYIVSDISIDELNTNTDLICDLRFDSFMLIELIVKIEEKFSIDLELELLDFGKISKWGEFIKYIDDHLN